MTAKDLLKSTASAVFPPLASAGTFINGVKNLIKPATPPAVAATTQAQTAARPPVTATSTVPTVPTIAKATSSTIAPARPPTAAATTTAAPKAPMATLVGPNGQKVAVESGSQQAQQYFGQGYTLQGANTPARPPTPTQTTPQAPTINPSAMRPPASVEQEQLQDQGAVSTATSPARDAQLKALQDAYTKSLGVSAEEEAVQRQLSDISARQAQEEQAYRLGDEKIRDQAIPMGLLTGQSAALQRQLTNRQTGYAAQATPLKDQLALLQAKRAAAGNVASKELEFERERLKAEEERNKPIEVGGSLLQYDPTSKTYKTVFSSPEKSQNAVTLGEGQILVDPVTGRQIAAGNAKPQSLESGFTLGEGQTRYDANGNPIAYGPTKTSSASTSAEQLKLRSNVESGLQSLQVLRDAENSFFNKNLPLGLGRQTAIGNGVYAAAKNNLVDVIGRLRSGGAISQDEAQRFESLLPEVDDRDDTAKFKLDQIEALLRPLVSGGAASQQGGQQGSDALDSALNSVGFKPAATVQAKNGSDARVEKLARAIAQHETGNRNIAGASGELSSRYQFLPSTWKEWAGKYLGNPNAPLTDANQDAVAKARISDLFNQGYDERQIALIWNGGQPVVKSGVNEYGVRYDTGKYANSVLSILKNLG